jgi:CheY-like chemotaxis protein
MQAQTEHLVRLVDDLLDVSRIMQGKIELRKKSVELSTLITRSVETVRGQIDNRQQSLAVSFPEQSLWLNADPVRLVQIVENLLNNASKYTDAGGQIELSVQSQGDQAVVDVRDNGIGIEPELLSQIFLPFTQSSRSLDRAQGGLGIGLTLAQQLVELHGGTISAHSDGPGLGSTFSLRLPVVHFEPKPKRRHEQPAISQGRRILVVDDNAGALKMLCMLLAKLGDHQIEKAHDGSTALVKIKEMHPEIVLLDIGLPKMDGYQVAKTIREIHEFDDVFLVALTGYGQDEDRKKSKAAGFDMHLVKPVEVSLLQQLLSEIRPRSLQSLTKDT